MNSYVDDIEELLIKSGCDNDFYSTHKPVIVRGQEKPLSRADRKRDAQFVKDRGYRRFIAEMMGGV